MDPEAYQHTRYPWNEPLYETALDFWTRRVHFGFAAWLGMKSGFTEEDPHCNRLYVLAGDQYVEPLLENEVFEPFPWVTRFPFQKHDFDGIGDQMAWLTEEAARFEQYTPDEIDPGEQIEIDKWLPASEPGIDSPDVDGQSDWGDWVDE